MQWNILTIWIHTLLSFLLLIPLSFLLIIFLFLSSSINHMTVVCFQLGNTFGESFEYTEKSQSFADFLTRLSWQINMFYSSSVSTAVSPVSTFLWVQTRERLWPPYLRLSSIWKFLTWCSLHLWSLGQETVSLSWWRASSTMYSESPHWCHALPSTSPSPTTRYRWFDAAPTSITLHVILFHL